MAEINWRLWKRVHQCYRCWANGKHVPATLRVFSGQYSSGGWPACDDEAHQGEAITKALRPLADARTSPDYEVIAYEQLVDEYGGPKMGRTLWVARKRLPAQSLETVTEERVAERHREAGHDTGKQ